MITVLFSKATAAAFKSDFSVTTSSALVASSSTMILDRWRIVRAMQRSCNWPAEKFSPPSRTSRSIRIRFYYMHVLYTAFLFLKYLILYYVYCINLLHILSPSGCEAITSLTWESSKACQISWSSCSESGSKFSLREIIHQTITIIKYTSRIVLKTLDVFRNKRPAKFHCLYIQT